MKSRLIIALVFLVSCSLLIFGLMRRENVSPATAESRIASPLLAVNKLKLPVKPEHDYRFIAFGDWGAGTPFQKDIAAQVTRSYQRTPYDAVLLLGDNIYPTGDIKKFGKSYFTDMYPVLIQSGVNFIVALGNHDRHDSHELDQLAFFRMPGFYYQVSKPHVDFFVLETNVFANDQVQQRWLDKALKDSRAEWKVVMGHHPIYSSGEHGMNPGLQKVLEPLLVKHKVDLYLAGHDHEYERFKPIKGVQHIVSGGGGAYLRDFEKPLPASLIRVKAHHFLSFDVSEYAMRMQVIDKFGKMIDHAEWTKAGQAQRLVKG